MSEVKNYKTNNLKRFNEEAMAKATSFLFELRSNTLEWVPVNVGMKRFDSNGDSQKLTEVHAISNTYTSKFLVRAGFLEIEKKEGKNHIKWCAGIPDKDSAIKLKEWEIEEIRLREEKKKESKVVVETVENSEKTDVKGTNIKITVEDSKKDTKKTFFDLVTRIESKIDAFEHKNACRHEEIMVKLNDLISLVDDPIKSEAAHIVEEINKIINK